MTNIRVVEDRPRVGRRPRKPEHTFSLRQRPWQIQPFMIAPVLPGDTLTNLLLRARIVTDPVKSNLVGWWAEHFFFYVKHRDLATGDTLVNMHLDATTNVAALKAGAQSLPFYTYNGGMDFVKECLAKVVAEYFRDEEDGTWNSKLIDTLPIAKLGLATGIQSLRDSTTAANPEDHELPGETYNVIPYGVDPAVWQTKYDTWRSMVAMGVTQASFEDYLATFGVKTPEVEEQESRPELLRYTRNWQYPSNTIDPASGAAVGAVSWSVGERADKDRFFNEPGFIFGVQIMRPKVYFGRQAGSLVGAMDDAFAWLPPIVNEQVWTSLKQFANNAGPLTGATNGYWFDLRDLFLYGDQFVNYDIVADGTGNSVVMPVAADHNHKFATAAMADSLFKNAAPANKIKTDGIVNMTILSRVGADETPGGA